MADASTTALDSARSEALRRTGVLKSAADPELDRLTRLANIMLHVPTVVMTLIDADRQVIKSSQGTPVALASSSDTSLWYSFCKHTIAKREPLIINDARLSPMGADNPAMRHHPAIAYAGIPLITADGHAIGAFCAIDATPRVWSEDDISVLSELAAMAMTLIDLRSAAAATDRERTEKMALLNSAGEGIYGIDLHGRCTFLNNAGAEMLGFVQEEALGRNMHELIHHSHPDGSPYPESDCPLFQAFRTGQTTHLDSERLWRRDGSSFTAEYSSSPVILDGAIIGAVVTFNDITERVAADEALRVAHRAMAATTTGIVISDLSLPDNPIIYHNPAFESITGYGGTDVIGRNCRFLQGSDTDQPGLTTLRQALVEKRPCQVVLKNYRKDGRLFWNELFISPVRDAFGKVTHCIGVQTDITDRKLAEEQLSEARQAAESANVAKSQFLANMSHELRTPLNAVILYSELLQEEAADLGVDAFIPDLEKIRTAGKQLLALVNDVLDLAKVEAGKMDLFLETFDVAALMDAVADTVRPLASKKNTVLTVECAANAGVMRADLAKVRQILLNLASNAVKFTEGGTITLTADRQIYEERDWLVFNVVDTGIGISAAQLTRLFQPFSQADASTTRKFGGTGLGLALTRRLCRIMEGDVAVESTTGAGSRFTVQLPAEVGEQLDPAEPQLGGDSLNSQPVLVIDDDPVVRDVLARALRQDGFRVAVAVDGEEGLRMARQEQPIAITLDVLMPKMDGWSVLEALKAEPALSRIPVIMLTLADNKDLGCMLGASDYLSKPVDQHQLLTLLETHRPSNAACEILIVDDDATTRRVLRRMLEGAHCVVSEAANGREALDRLAQARPDLILLDLLMPVMDGFALASEVRRQESLRSLPIIVLTAKDLTGDDRQRLAGNVKNVLQKGDLNRAELLREVRQLVERHSRVAGMADGA